jgi:polyphosphate kinase
MNEMEMPEELTCERAILDFKRRLLAQAQRTDVPLLEPLRHVCIVSSRHAQEGTTVPFDRRHVPGSG